MYTLLNLSGIPLQFDTAVREGDLDSLRLCVVCSNDDKIKILHNDEKHGYLGLCLANFPEDQHGGWQSSMSTQQRQKRLDMAEFLLDFGCSCDPKFVGVDQIERHVITALLRYPTEYEKVSVAEKNREIALCRRLIDGGARLDFFVAFPQRRALIHLLMSHHWLGMLRDIPEFHVLGAEITAQNLADVFDSLTSFNLPILGQMVSLDYMWGHPNALTVLALCNNCALPDGAYHRLQWDGDGVLVDMLHQRKMDPRALYKDKTVLRTWVDIMVSCEYALSPEYKLEQLKTFAHYHPECFTEVGEWMLGDMVVERVNTLYTDRRVLNVDIIVGELFETTQQQAQRQILDAAVSIEHAQVAVRKM